MTNDHPMILPETNDPPLAAASDCYRMASKLRAMGRNDLAERMERNARNVTLARGAPERTV